MAAVDIYSDVGLFRAFVLKGYLKGVLVGGYIADFGIYISVGIARKVGVIDFQLAARFIHSINVEIARPGSVRHIERGKGQLVGGNVRIARDILIDLTCLGGNLYPLIVGGLACGSVGKLTHPAFGFLRAAPVIHQYPSGVSGHGILFGFINPVYGLAVNEPNDMVFRPAESVFVILLGSVESQIIHVLVAALAVYEVVELNLGGIFAQELDIYLVVLVGNFVDRFVITGAYEERTCRTCLFGGLHGNGVVAETVVHGRSRFAGGIVEFDQLVVEIGCRRLLGDAEMHRAVRIGHVVL